MSPSPATHPSLLTTYYRSSPCRDKGVIRVRSLDIKDLVNEIYELLRSGD
ncbi:MAG: hypothetical protein RXO24_00900 [Acidilobus sp.]